MFRAVAGLRRVWGAIAQAMPGRRERHGRHGTAR
jgi:hypothetical protein